MLATSDTNRKLNKDRFDVSSIPNNVVKKGPSHGARHRNTERQRIYYAAHNAARKARKEEYKSILDRLLKSPRCRKSQSTIDGTKNVAPATTRLQPKITLLSRHRQSGAEMKILGSLY